MIRPGKPSDWTWSTSAGVSFSAAVVTKGEGHFVLTAPRGGDVRFNYEFVGVCKSFGADIGVSGSTEDLESVGNLYMADTFSGPELASDDLEGFCLIDDATAVFSGLLPAGAAGGSVTAMILGIPWQNVPSEIVEDQGALGTGIAFFSDHPWAAGVLGGAFFDEAGDSLNELLSTHARALLLMRGEAIGTGTSVGISASIGRVWTGRKPDLTTVPLPDPVIKSPEDIVIRTADMSSMVIRLPSDALFDFASYDLTPQAVTALVATTVKLKSRAPGTLFIEGHTDAIGGPKYNKWLSYKRAEAVADWLIANAGIRRSDITKIGRGLERPIAPNHFHNGKDNPRGRQKNRRVEIKLRT